MRAANRRTRRAQCAAGHSEGRNERDVPGVITGMNRNPDDTAEDVPQARLILVEQSGAKREIPQSSPVRGMIEAERAIQRHGPRLREVKLVSQHRAIARWKAEELGWRRVA